MLRWGLLSALLLAINGIAPSFSQTDCGESAVEKCSKGLNPMIKNTDLLLPDNEDDLNTACRYGMQYVDCIKNLANRCYTSPTKDAFLAVFSGFISFITEFCTPGTPYRTEYFKHASCYRTIDKEFQHCVDKYTVEAELMKTEKLSDEEKIKKSCCYMSSSTDCFIQPTMKKCGKAASDLIKRAAEQMYGPMTLICSSIEYDKSICSAAPPVTVSGFLFFMLMIIMSLKH